MPGISAKPTNLGEHRVIKRCWSTSRVPGGWFHSLELTAGVAGVCHHWSSAESQGRRLCPARHRGTGQGRVGSTAAAAASPLPPSPLPLCPPTKAPPTPFCPQLLFHTAWGRKQNTKKGLCSTFGPRLDWKVAGRQSEMKPLGLDNFPF